MNLALSLALVLLWVAVATYGDVQFKAAPAIASRQFAFGFVSYCACSFIALETFRRQSFGWVIIAWNCLALGLGLAVAFGFFHEPMTWRRTLSAALLLAAILLVE